MGSRNRDADIIRQLEECRDSLDLIQRISGIGFFQWDSVKDRFSCSGEFEALYGLGKGRFPCNFEGWLDLVHPEDRAEARRQLEAGLATGQYEAEWRVILPAGEIRWIGGRGYVFHDMNGNVERLVGIHIDITRRKMVEQEQSRSNAILEHYRIIFDSANDAFFIHCAESGAIIDVNRKAQEMYGYNREEICSLDVGELSAPGYSQEEALRVIHRVASGDPELFEWQGRHRSGRTFWVEVNLKRVVLEGKDRLLAVVRDITYRKQVTEALRESEEKFRTIADNISPLAWMADEAGNVMWYNRRWYDYTGTTPDEMTGTGWQKVHHPDYLPAVVEKLTRCFRTGELWEETMPLRRRDGAYRWFLSRAIPIRDDTGKVTRWFGTNTDITERRQAEEALRRSEERLSLAQQGAGIGIWNWDTATEEAVFSDNYFDILGIDRQDLSFDRFLSLINPDDRDTVLQVREEALREGGQFRVDFRIIQKDGSERWITSRGRVYRDDTGTPRRMAGIVFDITERKQNEQELNRTMEELARSNRELEQFAYVASHDLQEPLRMVTNYLRLLEKKYSGVISEKADEYIRFAVDGAQRMHRLIEGLLAYSRITSRREDFRAVDANIVFAGAVANLEEAIRESGAEVVRELLPIIKGNETQLLQLMQNLIANALKYRKAEVPPQIRVTARREGREWVFAVRDNGIGIDPKHYSRIFLIFQRLHTQEEYKGTGIGLASCKKIVENHHGRIWVESVPGEGSTFFFTIPLEQAV